MPDHDELDLLLDRALTTYADPGPDSGLERRMLAVLDAKRGAKAARPVGVRWRFWMAVAAPVAVSLLLWLSVSHIRRAPAVPAQQGQIAERPRAVEARALEPDHPATVHSGKRNAETGTRLRQAQSKGRVGLAQGRRESCSPKTAGGGHCSPAPKLNVFPAPQPLTSEEQTLTAVVRNRSEAVQAALLTAKPPSDAELGITALNVPPLAAADEGKR